MARLPLLFILVACISIAILNVEGKKKGKWKNKKSHQSLELYSPKDVANVADKSRKDSDQNIFGVKVYDTDRDLDAKLKHRWNKKWRKGKRGKHHKKTKGWKSRSKPRSSFKRNKADKIKKHMPWLHILSEKECTLQCNRKEVCIMGPLESKPLCVHYKDLKRSIKLFRKYKKKENKAWRKYHKKNYNHFQKNDVFGFKDEENFNKYDLEKEKMAMMTKQYMNKVKPGKEYVEEKKEENPMIALEPSEAGDPKACSTRDFSQMRTRIMGWFHLLHGQDKKAMKELRELKKHKHSVKKLLEADNGEHCQCMKSAMWEFGQMDKDNDDHLTETEMEVLEGNTMEPCMKPYLNSCDQDADGQLSGDEWCCCFAHVLAPCYKEMDTIRNSGNQETYMPRCDREGYYMPEQCKGVDDDNFVCWCVDYNGNIIDGTKTDGRTDCNKFSPFGTEKFEAA